MDIEKIKEFHKTESARARETSKTARKYCIELLKENGPIEWDYIEDYAPSISSAAFDDDLTDAYIVKIWVDEYDCVRAKLHAYYLDSDDTVSLDDELFVNWVSILGEIIFALE